MRRGRITWLPAAPESAPGDVGRVAAFAIAAEVTEVPAHDPPLADRDECIFLLHTAAEIEHALLAQYLYAAYSLEEDPERFRGPDIPANAAERVPVWRRLILRTAREEMGHLVTIQNLLRAIGGPLNFEREDLPFRAAFYPFHFRLEPLTKASLAKYVLAEMPVGALTEAQVAELRSRITEVHRGEQVNRVGALFARLLELVARLPESVFAAGSGSWQAEPPEWRAGAVALTREAGTNRIIAVGEGVLVMPTRTKAEALDALQAIALQGEAATAASGAMVTSHFRRFWDIYQDASFPNGPAAWHPERDLPTNPNTAPGPDRDEEVEAGRLDGRARLWAQLFNLRYRWLLAAMAHCLGIPRPATPTPGVKSPREILRDWTFAEMHQLRDITAVLVTLPLREATPDGRRAGPAFELPYTLAIPDREAARWRLYRDLVVTAGTLGGGIRALEPGEAEVNLLNTLAAADQQALSVVAAQLNEQLPITEILELRILPAIAIGRFGSSPEPLANYTLEPGAAGGPRQIRPAETLVVDPATGRVVRSFTPDTIRFRDSDNRIHPVAPFLEVWARFEEDGPLRPLTLPHLRDLGLEPQDLRWTVHAANLKAFRRTGAAGDRIEAIAEAFSDHAPKSLVGTAGNFKTGRSIPFGTVQYLQPTDAFPEIRFRFTPAAGKVYGPQAGDPNLAADVYRTDGPWVNHEDGTVGTPPFTNPAGIYARGPDGLSLGYLDDACDGIVTVELTANGRPLSASARFTAGPPAFAPDRLPVRTVAQELEQMLLGTEVDRTVEAGEIIDLVRRALDTVELMHTDTWNRSGMAAHDASVRAREPIFQPLTRASYAAARLFHAGLLTRLEGLRLPAGTPERAAAVGALRRILDLLRPFDRAGDLSNPGRQRMPAMMRGSDGFHLALTRRQVALVRKAIEQFDQPAQPGGTPEANMRQLIASLSFAAGLHAPIDAGGGRRLSELFNNPTELLNYLTTANAQGTIVPEANGQRLVVPGDPDASAFVRIISDPRHPMNAFFVQTDPVVNKTGIVIVREWIDSLTGEPHRRGMSLETAE